MSIYSSLEDGLYNTAVVALSEFPTVPAIFSFLSGTEPAESFVIINILSNTQIGHRSTSSLVSSGGLQSFQSFYEVMVQFSFCGSQSGAMSSSFNQRINNSQLVLQEQTRNNLGVMRKSPMRRAPQLRDTKWVEYHNLDVTFSYNVVTQEDVGIIEVVILENVLTQEIFTVPPGMPTFQ